MNKLYGESEIIKRKGASGMDFSDMRDKIQEIISVNNGLFKGQNEFELNAAHDIAEFISVQQSTNLAKIQDLELKLQQSIDTTDHIKEVCDGYEALVKLHEKYIQILGNELMDAGGIARIAGWRLTNEKEMTEIVAEISAINNKHTESLSQSEKGAEGNG